MRRYGLFVILALTMANAFAESLSCLQDRDTKAAMCYEPKSLRANGDLRSFTFATGGPKGVDKSPHLGVVNCRVRYLELRDKRGVVFARNIPSKKYVRALVTDICNEPKPRLDRSLD